LFKKRNEAVMAIRPSILAAGLLTALQCAPAFAEDATSPSDVDWSGYYFGAALGTPRDDNNWRIEGTSLALIPGRWRGSEVVLTFGRDWRRDNLVFGASLSVGNDQFLAQPTSAIFFTCVNCQTVASDLVTLRGRVGLVTGNTLFFASGGFARANATAANVGGVVVVGSDTLTGWSAGVGVERRLGESLSLSVAYDRVDLGALDLSDYNPGAVSDVGFGRMQVGMNFHW
jgi:opacity protein-like surface antigen